MIIRLKIYMLIPALLLMAACSPVRVVSTRQVQEVDFSAYRTYSFMEVEEEEEHPLKGRQQAIEALMNAISYELERRSLTRTQEGDLRINLGLWVEEKEQVRETSIYDSPPYYTGQRRYYWESTEVVTGTYKEGYVAVDVVDAERNELVWQGVAAGAVASGPDKNQKRIQQTMSRLFQRFPLKPL